jgi:hypothetical protein
MNYTCPMPPEGGSQLIDCNYTIVINGSTNILAIQLLSYRGKLSIGALHHDIKAVVQRHLKAKSDIEKRI